MEARIYRLASRSALLALLLVVSMGARQQSANFIVETPDANFAQQVSQAAEKFRHDLAIEWLGKAMPNWSQPCVMSVQVGQNLGAGGATTFVFDRGEVFGWRMSIQGSPQRILDSVLPHEITHMVYASHFRQPLPRWADEGGATSVEDASERNRHRNMLNQFLRTGRGIAFSQMFAMTEYPSDIMPLYAQGYSLAEYLIQTGGRREYIAFLGDGLKTDDWTAAIQQHYNMKDLSQLQNTWLAWVRQGSPMMKPKETKPDVILASDQRRARPEPNLIYHIRDKQPAEPMASLVPVQLPSPEKTKQKIVPADKWVPPLPASRSQEEPVVVAGSATPLASSASGWHTPGQPAPSNASPMQTAHPQPSEHARQTVLE